MAGAQGVACRDGQNIRYRQQRIDIGMHVAKFALKPCQQVGPQKTVETEVAREVVVLPDRLRTRQATQFGQHQLAGRCWHLDVQDPCSRCAWVVEELHAAAFPGRARYVGVLARIAVEGFFEKGIEGLASRGGYLVRLPDLDLYRAPREKEQRRDREITQNPRHQVADSRGRPATGATETGAPESSNTNHHDPGFRHPADQGVGRAIAPQIFAAARLQMACGVDEQVVTRR